MQLGDVLEFNWAAFVFLGNASPSEMDDMFPHWKYYIDDDDDDVRDARPIVFCTSCRENSNVLWCKSFEGFRLIARCVDAAG